MEEHEDAGGSTRERSQKGESVGKQRGMSADVRACLRHLDTIPLPADQLRYALDFLRVLLGTSGHRRFREFWDMRQRVLPLFGQFMPPAVRDSLWVAYVEITDEARHLKALIDEQGAFAVEQIELAIQVLDRDLANYTHLLNTFPSPLASVHIPAIGHRREIYQQLQTELHLLNALVTRLYALRKEIIKTDMRMKCRVHLLSRLSCIGDVVFPKRTERIQQLSDIFVEDVQRFADGVMGMATGQRSLVPLRTAIQGLQALAKALTLNTQAFVLTRTLLGQSWKIFVEADKQRRAEAMARQELVEQEKQQRQEIEQQEIARVEQVQAFVAEIQQALRDQEALSTGALEQRHVDGMSLLRSLPTTPAEKHKGEKLLCHLRDVIADKKEREVLGLPVEDQETCSQLHALLVEKVEMRRLLKEELEAHRKALGGSGWDFTQAMVYREMIDGGRARLAKLNESIEEIEQKIDAIEYGQ